MKKTAIIVTLTLFAICLLSLGSNGDGDPVDALLALVFGGGGILLAGAIMLVVGVVLAVVFASMGVLAVGALALLALVLVLAVSPLLLPLLAVGAIVWWLAGRGRRHASAA